ncbi:hypothetical protein DMP17_24700 [Pseudonocardia sp. TMWB2A]|uniref:hypothetical protein n=1 Tax=Pseudonocardia sp. TMWB2A TaxID=687430 RepID=UPI00307F6032
MSMYAFHLEGWEDLSTWGRDEDVYYAQLIRNDASDDEGPQIWISPPQYVIHDITELVRIVASSVGEPAELIDEAMGRGLALTRGERIPPVARRQR